MIDLGHAGADESYTKTAGAGASPVGAGRPPRVILEAMIKRTIAAKSAARNPPTWLMNL
jgi:hypothetical protein